ncbi:single-stranded-DNA-specific exonuclease RecJ [methanogenic archaeon mixed culture ISO4-G1]|nr:single-stranded-DNA-specific exonuclease RecJ [methanogenic archaeon mixed culture ISO4-G1]
MPVTDGDRGRMDRDISSAAANLSKAKSILIVSHIDADGITAGSIAKMTAERLGIEHRIMFVSKITPEVIDYVNNTPDDFVWICDLGSGYLSEFTKQNLVITDHHAPDPRWRRKQTVLDSFMSIDHLNPHTYGYDGSYEVCGAGMTYLLAKAIDPRNIDMAFLAVIGAVGDFQDSSHSRLVSINRDILEDAVSNGDVIVENDLRLFGRETRPIIQFFQYCTEPRLEGLTDNPNGCMDMLEFLNIPLKRDNQWRSWNDLSGEEKEKVTDNVLELVPINEQSRIYGEVYTLPKFEKGTGLRDAKEYATVLNSCGRYEDAETGMRICCGDKDALKDAEQNRADHRRHISTALSYVKDNHLIRERRFIQFFDAGDQIKDTVVGIVAGMLLNSPECRHNLPIIAFVDSDDGVKVSARANRDLVDRGLDLAAVMKTAAELVGGYGGGHSVAAGATIPKEEKEDFLDIVEDIVSSQVD